MTTGIESNHINNSCVYSNIDNEQQNPILWLLFIIANIKASASTSNLSLFKIFSYQNRGQFVFFEWLEKSSLFHCYFSLPISIWQ